jgi:hypothetical protein
MRDFVLVVSLLLPATDEERVTTPVRSREGGNPVLSQE